MVVQQSCCALMAGYVVLLQQVFVNVVESGDFFIFVCDEGLPRERRRCLCLPAVGLCFVVCVVGGGVGEQLFGHAAHVDAGAAVGFVFGNRDFLSCAGGAACRTHAP